MSKIKKLLCFVGNLALSYFIAIALVGNWARFTENLGVSRNAFVLLINYALWYPIIIYVALPLAVALTLIELKVRID